MIKIVKITYDDTLKQVSITYDSKKFDTSRIEGRDIADWLYPFIVKNVRWNGIYEELSKFIGSEEFTIVFDGSEKSLEALKAAVKDTPAKVAGTNNKVVILYNKESVSTKITINGKMFDTSRIQGRTIDEWVYPFQFNNVKWDGIFTELENEIGTNIYGISFVGEQADMKELMSICPDNVDITFRAPAAPKAAGTGSSLLSGAKDKLGNFTQNNDTAQKAKEAAVNAGKKFDEGVTNAVANIKNSEQYQKVMGNEKIQRVMENENVKKFSSFWGGLDKKIKYLICIVLALTIIIIPVMLLFGGNTVKLEPDNYIDAPKCKYKCDAGWVGFMGTDGIYELYFKADNPATVYRVESEDGERAETTAFEGGIRDKDYDTSVNGEDVDDDGYIEFTISEFNGKEYEEVCVIKGRTKD